MFPPTMMPGTKGELDSRITMEFHQSGDTSSADSDTTGTASGGMATVAFYPDGTADAGSIQLRDRQGYRLRLEINPVTARVHVVEMEREEHP